VCGLSGFGNGEGAHNGPPKWRVPALFQDAVGMPRIERECALCT
jgi:hypothetical protein